MRWRGGRENPTHQAHRIRAGATAAFSLHKSPAAIASALHPMLSRTTAAYTPRHTNTAAINSARPITFATASTWTGCTANSNPATTAAVQLAQRRTSVVTATAAPACHTRLTAWNHQAFPTSPSIVYVATVRGR